MYKPKNLKKKYIEKTVLDLAYERINRAYDLYDTVDVAFSGGKDSTACLNLTLEVAKQRNRLPLRVFFWDEEAIPYQTEEYVRRVSQLPGISLEWYCLPVKHRNACSKQHPWWSPWDKAQEELWVRSLPQEARTELEGFNTDGEPRDRLSIPDAKALLHDPKKYGTCGVIMGIRGQESLTRLRAVSSRKHENYMIHWKGGISKNNIWKVYPIYDWETEDVWTAPDLLGWDYNHAYDVMEQCGVPRPAQRCSPAYGEEPLEKFYIYKTCFPEIWDKMSVRVPGANAAMLYSRTELWGFGKMGVHEVEGWESLITKELERFHEKDRAYTAKAIKKSIQEHYRQTTDPILNDVTHPVTGISWEVLYKASIRGDFKERKLRTVKKDTVLSTTISQEKKDAMWKKYNEARLKEGKE